MPSWVISKNRFTGGPQPPILGLRNHAPPESGAGGPLGKFFGSAIMYRMKNNRLALEALPQASTQQTLFFSVLYKMALPVFY